MIETIYLKIFVDPWPYWAGGILIGLLVPLLYHYFNTALGVSTGYGNLAKIVIPSSKSLAWIKTDFAETLSWRVYFIAGIILGGLISAILSGKAGLDFGMGLLTEMTSWPAILYTLYFFVGGLLLGLGARIAGGCTSGHSIHGIANLHLSSIMATIFFIAGGVIAANIARVIFMRGAF